MTLSPARIDDVLDRALGEDLGVAGDITSKAIFAETDRAAAVIKSKEEGILSGTAVLQPLFGRIDPSVQVVPVLEDGARVDRKSVICRLEGPIIGILSGERIALNFLQRLSGIATATARLAGMIRHTRARLLDTRKTTPTLRILERKAVVDGGGLNHRFGLFDMVLIKDTHVAAAGGVQAALQRVQSRLGERRDIKVEVEVQTEEELRQAVQFRPDRIMLDNMGIEEMARCVAYVRESALPVELEASGGISKGTITAVAETGVDFISCGWITHSAPALDMHLVIE